MCPDAFRTIDALVDQQKIAHQQRPLHRFRRNSEGLQDKGQRKERHHNDGKQRPYRFERRGIDKVHLHRRLHSCPRRCRRRNRFRVVFLGRNFRIVNTLPHSSAPVSSTGFPRSSFMMARRAASCSAFFLVLPNPRASAFTLLPFFATNTSTRNRLRWSGPPSAFTTYSG